MENLWEELFWVTSFNPPNPILNVKHAEKLKKMYLQMIHQFPGKKSIKENYQNRFDEFEIKYIKWQQTNWPY